MTEHNHAELEEDERQLILLALAELSLSRPEYQPTTLTIAEKLDGVPFYDSFQIMSEARIKAACARLAASTAIKSGEVMMALEPSAQPSGHQFVTVEDEWHKRRHGELHAALDENAACWIEKSGMRPSQITLLDFMLWSGAEWRTGGG